MKCFAALLLVMALLLSVHGVRRICGNYENFGVACTILSATVD